MPESETILQRTDQYGEHYRVDLEIIEHNMTARGCLRTGCSSTW